jgi:CobQ-like glutamine amidotransferase family enzyme
MPEHFNNNGDQGNMEVLSAELAAVRAPHKAISEIDSADFVLLGDASRAAMRHYEKELEGLRPLVRERFAQGLATLLVGSCYEFFASDLGLELRPVARRSGFVAGEYFGYRNTEYDLKPVTRNGLFVATSLYGPFLAKNPGYLSELLIGLGANPELKPERLLWIEKIREVSGG